MFRQNKALNSPRRSQHKRAKATLLLIGSLCCTQPLYAQSTTLDQPTAQIQAPASIQTTASQTANSRKAQQASGARVATALPVTYLITQSLLANTPVAVDYLPAKRYPVSRLPYWLNKKLPLKQDQLPQYSGLVTVASVWPQLTLYPQLRQQNIRIVPVDAAVQLKPQGAKVSLVADKDRADQHYFWLAPDNLKVMNRIIAEDLSLLWPDHGQQIRRNEQSNDQSISRFQLDLDDKLWQQEWDGLCSIQEELKPLLLSLSLPVLGDSATDSTELEGMRCLWITDKKPKAEQSATQQSSAQQWTLNSLNRYYGKDLNSWLQSNLKQLDKLTR